MSKRIFFIQHQQQLLILFLVLYEATPYFFTSCTFEITEGLFIHSLRNSKFLHLNAYMTDSLTSICFDLTRLKTLSARCYGNQEMMDLNFVFIY